MSIADQVKENRGIRFVGHIGNIGFFLQGRGVDMLKQVVPIVPRGGGRQAG